MKKNKRRRSGARTIYLLIALMIITAVFTGAILGWLIWYGISGGVSKPRETEAVETEESTQEAIPGQTEAEEETLPDAAEIPGANLQLMFIPNGETMVMHEGNMGFTMEAPREWADRVVSRYEEELDGTTLVFYEKENMLAASGDAEDQGVLFSIKEYRTTDAVLPVGEEVQVLREADPGQNITAVIAAVPREPVYGESLEQPYRNIERNVPNVLSTFAWEEKGEDIRFDLAEGVTVMLPYYWADRYEAGRAEDVEIAEGITGIVYDFYESANHAADGSGLLMRLFVHDMDTDVSSVSGYQREVAEIPSVNGQEALGVSWFSMEGQYDAADAELTYQYLYLFSSIPWVMDNNISIMEAEETTEPPTTPAPTEPPTTPAPTEPPTTPAPETEPPTTPAPETEPPTTPAPETEPPTTPAPETEPPTVPETEPPTTPAVSEPSSQPAA